MFYFLERRLYKRMLHNSYISNKYLIYSLFVLIFFQNAFVLSVGGSIKWYELASALCIMYLCLGIEKLHFNKYSLLLFILFLVSPLISDFTSLLLKPFETNIYEDYRIRFPESIVNLRVNYYFSLIYNFVLSFGCFSIMYYIIHSEYIYNNYLKVVKLFIYTGSIVALYSLYQIFGITILGLPDIVPAFLDARNYRGHQMRVGGFSIEPGSYVVIQSLVVFYLLIHKRCFKARKTHLLFLLNFTALLLTLSSSMLITLFCIALYILFFSKKRTLRFFCILLLIVFCIFIPILDAATNHMLQYVFVTKIRNFLSSPKNTLDSGAMRAYTSGIGYKIFKSKPLFGCGLGNSIYYMPQYEYSMGITVWGEKITATSAPQNNISKIFAEQGLFGIVPFFLLFFNSLKDFYKHRNDSISITYFIIAIFLLIVNFTAGVYLTNLFLWLNLALGINYISHKYK